MAMGKTIIASNVDGTSEVINTIKMAGLWKPITWF
jgi:hypothetical protein